MDVCSGAGHDYHSRASEFTPVLSWVRVALSFAFFAVFCRSLFVLFLLADALLVRLD
jgi:hypothetical protein